jgi:bifunctional non-homologous end joining protein LigD
LDAARITHPDRILWTDVGLTKLGLAEFYVEVADRILPHIVNRPLSLLRCPSGVGEECFFQKRAWQGLDEALVQRIRIGDDEALAIRDLSGLIALVQASVLEIHPWGSSLESPEKPDRVIFDLDPGEGVEWSSIVLGAEEVRDRLSALSLESFVKTSGGKGLHVVLPIVPRSSWEDVKQFSADVASAMAKDSPDLYTDTIAKRARTGRIFVDYLRNGRGATAVSAYSTRSREGAPVSTPVEWRELNALRSGNQYRVENLPSRLRHLGRDPWAGFAEVSQTLPQKKQARKR